MSEKTFTLEDYTNTKFSKFWLSDEENSELERLLQPLREHCMAKGIPYVTIFGTGCREDDCRVSTSANFEPLSRVQPELLLAYQLANNGPSEDFKGLYGYMEEVHATKFPVTEEE